MVCRHRASRQPSADDRSSCSRPGARAHAADGQEQLGFLRNHRRRGPDKSERRRDGPRRGATRMEIHRRRYPMVRAKCAGHEYSPGAHLSMDEYGRLLPAVNRFPSAANGKGFKLLAWKDAGISAQSATLRDLWGKTDLGRQDALRLSSLRMPVSSIDWPICGKCDRFRV